METQKKFSYGLKKSKYMVINTGREKEDVIQEKLKKGEVQKINEYRYLGLWFNDKGNLITHIEKLKDTVPAKLCGIKSIASS